MELLKQAVKRRDETMTDTCKQDTAIAGSVLSPVERKQWKIVSSPGKTGKEVRITEQQEENRSDKTLRFEWTDYADTGYYSGALFDGEEPIDNVSFYDFTCDFNRRYDERFCIYRAYAFEVHWGSCRSDDQNFDFYEDWDKSYGYNGTAAHTVNDIKRWCENRMAERCIETYETMLKDLDTARRRAEWFTANGYNKKEAASVV